MAALHVKKGDNVVVLSGEDKGVVGEVLAVSPEEGKVIVKGVNIIHKHVKPRREGESGGIVDAEGAIYASNVALICPECGKAARVMHKVNVTEENGKKIRTVTRVAAHKKCGYPEIK